MKYIGAAALAATAILLASSQVLAQAQVSGNSFNPAISLILNGTYASYSRSPGDYGLSGFALTEGAGPGPEGVSIDETELALSANVDDKFYGFASVALEEDAGETTGSLEEAWFETLTLPGGLKLKAGRFLSDIGYLNPVHSHAWDFADAPLAYRAMLGSSYSDSGLQVRWVAPSILYVELGAELLRGDSYPAAGGDRSGGTGAHTAFAHFGGDIGASSSWRAGVSHLSADAHDRQSAVDDAVLAFDGNSDLTIVDFVWKWARNGNPRDRNIIVQGEFLDRSEAGSLAYETGSAPAAHGVYDGDQSGWYLQGVYQFHPRWRVGLRLDRLGADNRVIGITAPLPLDAMHDPKRVSLMVDFSNSEFSRLRLQWNRDESTPETDDQMYLQYLMSLGAHGAHRF